MEQTSLFGFYGAVQTPLNLSGHMQEMPDIALEAQWPTLAHCGHQSHSDSPFRAGCCIVHQGPGRAELRLVVDSATFEPVARLL